MSEKQPRQTIIYGGAFNPPTRAHQAILQACVDYAEPRQADVWLLPSASRKDKVIEGDRERRLVLCSALIQDVMRRTVEVDINTLELDRKGPTETYDTVRELENRFPGRQFSWVFGADSVATMKRWNHGSWLLERLTLLVVERPGYPVDPLGAHVVKLEVDTGDVSSTELRKRLREGRPYEDLVGSSVSAFLAQKR